VTERSARSSYLAVCSALRETLRAAIVADLSPLDLRSLGAVLVLTASYSRLNDELGSRQIAAEVYGVDWDAVTGGQRRRVAGALRHLEELGVVAYESSAGRSARARVAIGATKVAGATPFDDEEGVARATASDVKGVGSERERDRRRAVKGSRARGHTEVELPKKNPEEERSRRSTKTRSARPSEIQRVDASEVEVLDLRSPNGGRAPKVRRPRARDTLFDAVVDAFGINLADVTTSGRGAINRACKELRAVSADPAEVATRRKVLEWQWEGGRARVTPLALAKHWDKGDPRNPANYTSDRREWIELKLEIAKADAEEQCRGER
jgi:hypothetical protein